MKGNLNMMSIVKKNLNMMSVFFHYNTKPLNIEKLKKCI